MKFLHDRLFAATQIPLYFQHENDISTSNLIDEARATGLITVILVTSSSGQAPRILFLQIICCSFKSKLDFQKLSAYSLYYVGRLAKDIRQRTPGPTADMS